MKKRIITFLLAGTLVLTGGAEGIFAAAVSSAEQMETESEEIDAAGITQVRAGGLEKPEYQEIPEEELSGIYDEDIDATGSAAYSSEWDCYSTNYYYNLLSGEQKEFWNKLDSMCLSYLVGTENVAAARDSRGNVIYPTKAVLYSGMSQTSAVQTALMFKYSNPQYYFLDIGLYGSTAGSGGFLEFELFPAFANGASRAAATAQMKAVIDNWMAQINAQPGELAKEKKAHDLICEKVVYDPGYEDSSIPMNEYNQVAYSVFCTDSTVCAGYSQAMQLLMNAAGIDCGVVTSQEHEWNIIRLNNIWYYVDLTWDDLSAEDAAYLGQGVGYLYFNRSQAQYMNDHPVNAAMHTAESIWNGYLPELTYDTNSTWKEPGALNSPVAVLAAPQFTVSGDKVSITAPSGGTVYYTTDGRNPSIASSRSSKYTGAFKVSGNVTVKAVAVANGYADSAVSETAVAPKQTITFNANGGYIKKTSVKKTTKTVAFGSKIGTLPTAKRKGYAFLGWYTKKSGGSQITKTTKVTASKTYYARWAKINPKKVSISSVKSSASGKMTVKIKKNSSASGYEIRYSLKANMSSSKKTSVTDTSKTISKLKKGKKYYVQVRMYQKESVSGKKSYGAWSKTKSVKIKK